MEHRREQLRNQSTEHDYCGGFTTIVKLTGAKVGEYFIGCYEYFKIKHMLKFLKYEGTAQNISNCDDIVFLSDKAKTYLLAPEIFGTMCDRFIVIGYRFSAIVDGLYGSLNKPNGILDLGLRTNIRNMLETIKQMHSKSVFHGKLSDKNSYVYRGQLLHIVAPTIDGELESQEDIERRKKKDLVDFGNFLVAFTRFGGYLSKDWEFFLALFQRTQIDIQTLINHPVLKDADEKFEYFRGWYDCCYQNRIDMNEYDGLKNKLCTLVSLPDWGLKIKPGFFEDRFKAKFYYRTDLYELLRYIRNLLKYYLENDDTLTVSKIENDLSLMFPGLISAMHNACVIYNSDFYRFAFE